MCQRLGIACAIMEQPALLLLDEPFNGLDESGCRLAQEIIREQRGRGCLVLLACHDRSELETLSDCIYQVAEGNWKWEDGNGYPASGERTGIAELTFLKARWIRPAFPLNPAHGTKLRFECPVHYGD